MTLWSTIFHIPPDYVVAPRSSHDTLDLSRRDPHDVSSTPPATHMEMRQGTGRQTDTPQPHDHR
jgi:hypothetical protein